MFRQTKNFRLTLATTQNLQVLYYFLRPEINWQVLDHDAGSFQAYVHDIPLEPVSIVSEFFRSHPHKYNHVFAGIYGVIVACHLLDSIPLL